MEELIARVAERADIPADQAERAINLVFAFLRKQAPQPFEEVQEKIPGAAQAAAAGDADDPVGGGILGNLMSKMGGDGLMGLAGRLTGLGLGTGEMAAVGKEIFAFAREHAGEERVDEVAAAIPGLSSLI